MDRRVQRLLRRTSLAMAAVATLSLLHLFYRSSLSCSAAAVSHRPHHTHTAALAPFPRSSCDSAARAHLPPDRRFAKLRSSPSWTRRALSLASAFALLRDVGALRNASRVLCVPAGAGLEVAAFHDSGVADVTGVDVLDFPPLVRRADPHNLPFFDGVFDLAFSPDGLVGALFPARFAAEMERTVRRGGTAVLAIDRWGSQEELHQMARLFKKSSLLAMRNVTTVGSEMTMVIMTKNAS